MFAPGLFVSTHEYALQNSLLVRQSKLANRKAYMPYHPFSEHANPKLVIYIDDESSKSCGIMLTDAGNLH
tara:strand:+ start:496 stop:705 length:210 start_codon:yes stop_codon:yes gene_type:complete